MQPPRLDLPEAAEAARQRLRPPNLILQIFKSIRSTRSTSQKSDKRDSQPLVQIIRDAEFENAPPPFSVSDILCGDLVYVNNTKDTYAWAIVYEHQRGATILSVPYYSRESLLPGIDPPSYAIPTTAHNRKHQPYITLTQYPLPDGAWRWVSKTWMVDMRGDSGEVQYDGFEYNRWFRDKKWKSDPRSTFFGRYIAGGWVRRRRWLRLMVRPGTHCDHHADSVSQSTQHLPSVPPSITSEPLLRPQFNTVWKSLDTEPFGDVSMDLIVSRCNAVLKGLSDGRKLEVWTLWLGLGSSSSIPNASEVSPESVRHNIHSAPRDILILTLRRHVDALLNVFIFPESRSSFLNLLSQADLVPKLDSTLSIESSATNNNLIPILNFWSYLSDRPMHT